jgi:hypothetical protein
VPLHDDAKSQLNARYLEGLASIEKRKIKDEARGAAVSGSEEFIFSWLEELIRFRVESNAVLLSALLSEIVLKINSNI